MSEVINILRAGAESGAAEIRSFATSPKGVFETLDGVVRAGRNTSRQLVQKVSGGKFSGQIRRIGRGRNSYNSPLRNFSGQMRRMGGGRNPVNSPLINTTGECNLFPRKLVKRF